jgi:hypothetical protein
MGYRPGQALGGEVFAVSGAAFGLPDRRPGFRCLTFESEERETWTASMSLRFASADGSINRSMGYLAVYVKSEFWLSGASRMIWTWVTRQEIVPYGT